VLVICVFELESTVKPTLLTCVSVGTLAVNVKVLLRMKHEVSLLREEYIKSRHEVCAAH